MPLLDNFPYGTRSFCSLASYIPLPGSGDHETLDALLAPLRVGHEHCSTDSFTVHPIQLVVFEQKISGAVGATLNDLYEAVDLVARGAVRTVVGRTLPLEQFESGLSALERGELVGRAVLVPDA